MSKKGVSLDHGILSDVKVEVHGRRDSAPIDSFDKRMRRKSKQAGRSSEFVYVNNAYVGSLNSVNEPRIQEPPTSVIREQYWACSKWPLAQRILAIAVGVLLGAVIGLAVTMVLRAATPDVEIGGIFRNSAPD